MLLDLQSDLMKSLPLRVAHIRDRDLEGVVDIGQVAHGKLDVDNRSLDARDASSGRLGRRLLGNRCGLVLSHMRSYSSSLFSASALPMISVSSWVIEA